MVVYTLIIFGLAAIKKKFISEDFYVKEQIIWFKSRFLTYQMQIATP